MKEISCKLLVIGAGPGGYVCAIRAGQLGVDTVIVEAGKPGGTCLNVGCIPSKALIHAAEEFEKVAHMAGGKSPLGISVTAPVLDLARTVAWKDGIVSRLNSGVAGLLKKAGVKTVQGWATFRDGKTVEVETETGSQVIRAETIVIATGSAPVELSFLPFGGPVISSTEALALSEVPKKLAVVGGGYIGLELGMAFAKMGAEVTVVEALPRVLAQYDSELTGPVVKRLAALGIEVMTGAKARGLSTKGDALLVETSDGKSGKVAADKILVTVGRKPVTEGWGLEQIDLDTAGKFIRIDDQCRTSMRGVFAIGDVTGEPMLAHRAMAQGEMVAEIVAGHKRNWDKRSIPAVCFTDPELVTAGLSPEEAKGQGEVKIGMFPFAANGRAMTKLGEDGFVRVVARADNHLVLGIQAVGQGVSELSAAFGLALEMGARLEDIAGTIHAHPTQGEGFQEAALKALGHALHI
ncbi:MULTISPECIES: dihydrolipoyl dehydrogenase [unclassified Mesorhizobium]|uniref:dihydrolipoyl dehydrogenase n=1 Tax=unclassified Mesorhizobium TaxID=325217 RepID=UPI000FDBEFE9|nr:MULTISPECIES: dihydrolipoyl dehydrogenase [unclassified Mesorhizobium]TGR36565.1 dihydrolipoyl dehydrogenase [bacterium M00.F.Ca.ET.199.01.1.1]TGU28203.1 dihydrolipoyl dehydrogenase [bacterium M00.F.Ca.ET.156.01.1.1]TGV81673.1 dihydrolipoyl dehydrogenase [Mesorhizobium sp. M00.F.Ca.ET.149.01.1.1]TGR17690.1 dihydrolipoyl dehydrogenase [Mesorhizobium sp. M8A.F.Ca.ET.197.01.1.1]TGR21669.1 dihydrolipoyl dehydrogenase [Mesorhizobium sp. M8A.F.Ca.ET.202.01.1.1]